LFAIFQRRDEVAVAAAAPAAQTMYYSMQSGGGTGEWFGTREKKREAMSIDG
jgi:hypothetical protein